MFIYTLQDIAGTIILLIILLSVFIPIICRKIFLYKERFNKWISGIFKREDNKNNHELSDTADSRAKRYIGLLDTYLHKGQNSISVKEYYQQPHEGTRFKISGHVQEYEVVSIIGVENGVLGVKVKPTTQIDYPKGAALWFTDNRAGHE